MTMLVLFLGKLSKIQPYSLSTYTIKSAKVHFKKTWKHEDYFLTLQLSLNRVVKLFFRNLSVLKFFIVVNMSYIKITFTQKIMSVL